MKYDVILSNIAQEDLRYFKRSAPASYKKALRLLAELLTHPETGTGKPERLRYNLAGCWSRRINEEHRMIYRINGERVEVHVMSMRYHYMKAQYNTKESRAGNIPPFFMPETRQPSGTASGPPQALAAAFLSRIFAKFTTFAGPRIFAAGFADICSHICKVSDMCRDFPGRGHLQPFAVADICRDFCCLGHLQPVQRLFPAAPDMCSVCLNACSHINENPGSSSQKAGASVEV